MYSCEKKINFANHYKYNTYERVSRKDFGSL